MQCTFRSGFAVFSPINDLQNFHSSQLPSTCTNCFYIVFYHHYMAEILPIWPGTLINECFYFLIIFLYFYKDEKSSSPDYVYMYHILTCQVFYSLTWPHDHKMRKYLSLKLYFEYLKFYKTHNFNYLQLLTNCTLKHFLKILVH